MAQPALPLTSCTLTFSLSWLAIRLFTLFRILATFLLAALTEPTLKLHIVRMGVGIFNFPNMTFF